MEIYVYEHVTATSQASDGDPLFGDSLFVEAAAMRDAVSADFAELDGVEVLNGFADQFDALAAACDGVLLIAPETGGILTDLARRAEAVGGRLLSPSSSFCAWASDKSRVAATVQAAGVPMPRGFFLRPGDSIPAGFSRPAVLKPNDGCGSQGVRLIEASVGNALRGVPYRMECYVPGVAASVALLGGSAGVFPLAACLQRLTDDGTFQYLGGSCPLEDALAQRAERLARRAAAAMPEWRGYIGVDLVLGDARDGSQDFLIEVNPRLTTSYVGLRARSQVNLAAAMLDVVAGRKPQLAFHDETVEFDADGTVRSAGTSPAAK